MSTDPLVPAPLYGLRTWAVSAGEDGEERLAGPQLGALWPTGGAWMRAACARTPEHAAPVHDCECGLHAWHPSRRSARRVLSLRGQVPGIVAARGAIEVHDEGFRAAEARPHAFVLAPGANAPRVRRLAGAHRAQVVEVGGADDVVAFCQAHGLGLERAVVEGLLGPEAVREGRRARSRRARRDLLRLGAAVAVAALLVAGADLVTDPPGDRTLFGRTGEVHPRSP